jgi:Fe-Mn family superoxide dismutase
MKKREFLKNTGILTLGSLAAPLFFDSCKTASAATVSTSVVSNTPILHELPALEYAYNALDPYIDAMTMEIHHSKHHAGYVKNLNKALEGHEWASSNLETIFENLTKEEKYNAIRNNGGGHYNHSLYWKTIGPNTMTSPQGKFAEIINQEFGSFDNLKNKMIESAMTVFGSGWTWLSVDANGKLFISNTANQDNPLMKNVVSKKGTPVLGIDVWEHAYYLKHQNKRKDYLTSFFNVVRWDRVAELHEKSVKK